MGGCETNRSTQAYTSRTDVMVDNKTHDHIKLTPSNDSEGSLKKRKLDVTESDVSALTDSIAHKLSDILSIALIMFKGSETK